MHASLNICIKSLYIYMRAHVHTHTHIHMEKEYRPQTKPLAQISSGTNSDSPMDSLCYDPMI